MWLVVQLDGGGSVVLHLTLWNSSNSVGTQLQNGSEVTDSVHLECLEVTIGRFAPVLSLKFSMPELVGSLLP